MEDVRKVIDARPEPTRCLIVTAEPITDIDTTAAEEHKELVDHLTDRGIELRFAELKGHVRERLEQYRVFDHDPSRFDARTVGEAVKRYLHEHDVDWLDWEDRAGTDTDAPPAAG